MNSTQNLADPEAKPLPVEIERDQDAIPCTCGGYCDAVDPTDSECARFGCGLDRIGRYYCCVVAFVCRVCKARFAGKQPAPDVG